MPRTASIHATFLNIRGEGGATARLHHVCAMLTLANICSGRAASLDGTCAAPYDVIIASDLVYSVMGARLLAHSIIDNLKPGGMLLMVCEYSPLLYLHFFVGAAHLSSTGTCH
jgi:hypothetical protein